MPRWRRSTTTCSASSGRLDAVAAQRPGTGVVARQRDIGKTFILERQLRALDVFVRARALQALRKVAPVGRLQRACAVMRAGGDDMRADGDQLLAQPAVSKAEITAKLCTPEGVTLAKVPRRARADYASARRWRWGDALIA